MTLECGVALNRRLLFPKKQKAFLTDSLFPHCYFSSTCQGSLEFSFIVVLCPLRPPIVCCVTSNLLHLCLSSRCGGTVGAILTCPLEVVKTRLQSSTITLYVSEVQLSTVNGASVARVAPPGPLHCLKWVLNDWDHHSDTSNSLSVWCFVDITSFFITNKLMFILLSCSNIYNSKLTHI